MSCNGCLADCSVELSETTKCLSALRFQLATRLWLASPCSRAAALVATMAVLHVRLEVTCRQVRATTSGYTVLRTTVSANKDSPKRRFLNSLNTVATPVKTTKKCIATTIGRGCSNISVPHAFLVSFVGTVKTKDMLARYLKKSTNIF